MVELLFFLDISLSTTFLSPASKTFKFCLLFIQTAFNWLNLLQFKLKHLLVEIEIYLALALRIFKFRPAGNQLACCIRYGALIKLFKRCPCSCRLRSTLLSLPSVREKLFFKFSHTSDLSSLAEALESLALGCLAFRLQVSFLRFEILYLLL